MNVALLNKIRYLLVSAIEEIKELLNRSYLIVVSMESLLHIFYFMETLFHKSVPKCNTCFYKNSNRTDISFAQNIYVRTEFFSKQKESTQKEFLREK